MADEDCRPIPNKRGPDPESRGVKFLNCFQSGHHRSEAVKIFADGFERWMESLPMSATNFFLSGISGQNSRSDRAVRLPFGSTQSDFRLGILF